MNEVERRITATDALELRVLGDEKKPKLEGYAALFGKVSEDLGFREIIEKGAFAGALKTSDVRALWNHDSNFVLGRVKARTLEVREDANGLRIAILPPDTQWARDLLTSIGRGDVDQMSFGFRVKTDKWEFQDGEPLRTIVEVEELLDVSPVTYPAYPDTTVAVRSLERWKEAVATETAAEKVTPPASWRETLDTLQRRLILARDR